MESDNSAFASQVQKISINTSAHVDHCCMTCAIGLQFAVWNRNTKLGKLGFRGRVPCLLKKIFRNPVMVKEGCTIFGTIDALIKKTQQEPFDVYPQPIAMDTFYRTD
jgi:hypothetical protein